MPARGDDHVRREQIAKARNFLPGIRGLAAGERSRKLGEHLGISTRQATRIRIAAEREIADAADDACPPAVARQRLLDDINDIAEHAIAAFRECPADQPASRIAALKLLFQLRLERAKWEGVRPADPENTDAGRRPVVFELGPTDGR